MQFEHFDNKIREAADHHHPAYDEKAWEKMEKLLDKHLPQKKDDRRRIIFLLLLFVLLGGGTTWFLLGRAGHPDKITSTTNQKDQSANIVETKNNKQNIPAKDKSSLTPNNSIISTSPLASESKDKNSLQKKAGDKATPAFDRFKYNQSVVSMINDRLKRTIRKNATLPGNANKGNKEQTIESIVPNNVSGQETGNNAPKKITDNKSVTQNPVNFENSNIEAAGKKNLPLTSNSSLVKINTGTVSENKPGDAEKKDVVANTNKTSSPKKVISKNRKSNYFFLSLSAGPDISAAGITRTGKVKPVYGIGVGFSFHDKFSLRTGFYSARKVYTASPDEYHPPYNFWTYYPYLKKVDADCRVFEIPLTLGYNFTHSNGHAIFGTAGISSYFMKRETYNYISKLPSGQINERQQTYYDKNKHFFSVVTLSGGYQRNLTQSISIAAEPYVKIPVDGIGFGKVQLNSAGVLFSLQIKPFFAKKNK